MLDTLTEPRIITIRETTRIRKGLRIENPDMVRVGTEV
jgi:hypothetical protein